MVNALFITRAQPLHNGHVYAIRDAMKKFDEVVIGIGSSNESNTWRNPFTFEERKEMFKLAEIDCKIIGIPDIENDDEWCKNTLKMEEFDVVITGSEWVRNCFSEIKEVIVPAFFMPEVYSGTKIREKIAKSEEWKDLVPKKVASYIRRINGEERIRKLAEMEIDF